MTILPITAAADAADRITGAAVAGFVVWTMADDDPVIAAVQARKRPGAVHGGPATPGLALVSIDNRAAAEAVGALVFADARRPAVVSQPLSRARVSTISRGVDVAEVLFPVTRDRLAGYRRAAEATGTAWADVVVAVCARNDAAEAGRIAATLLASAQPPDAIAAMSDVAVTGWDDAEVAARLGLTTVRQSLREQGAACAFAALGQRPESFAAAWSIVRRGSTAGAPPVRRSLP